MDVRLGHLLTHDGLKLHYEFWVPQVPRAGIVLVHGIGDHCGRYGPFVRHFTDLGFVLALFDMRGHGKSEGRRAHVEQIESFLEDLTEFSRFGKRSFPEIQSWFIVGHSFGGQLLLNFIASRPLFFQGAVVTSPNIRLALKISKQKRKVVEWLDRYWPTAKLKGEIHSEWLSRDPAVCTSYNRDPQVSRFVTARGAVELMANQSMIYSLCSLIQTPILMLHGTGDRVTEWEGTRFFFDEIPYAQKNLQLYEGWYHELFNEVGKEKVFADVASWIESRLAGSGGARAASGGG